MAKINAKREIGSSARGIECKERGIGCKKSEIEINNSKLDCQAARSLAFFAVAVAIQKQFRSKSECSFDTTFFGSVRLR